MESVYVLLRVGRELVRRVLRRFDVFGATFVFTIVVCVGAVAFIGPRYSSSMLVTAVSTQQSNGLSRLGALLPGLAGLAGSFSGSGDQFANYTELLQSNTVARAILADPSLVNEIYGNALDPKTGKWRDTLGRRVKSWFNDLVGLPTPNGPTVESLQPLLQQYVIVNPASATDLRTLELSCSSISPTLCRDLLLAVHRADEASLRHDTLAVAKRTAVYVIQQLQQNQLMEVRESLITVLTQAETQIATSAGGQPVGAIIIDEPQVPLVASFPKWSLVGVVAVGLGIALGFAAAWVAEALNWRVFGARPRVSRVTSYFAQLWR